MYLWNSNGFYQIIRHFKTWNWDYEGQTIRNILRVFTGDMPAIIISKFGMSLSFIKGKGNC